MPMPLVVCEAQAPDLELSDEVVELITDNVSEALVLPFIPTAFRELFVERMVRLVLQQAGPELPQRIRAFSERNEDAFDAAGLEGLVEEIVEQVEHNVSVPLLDAEQKHVLCTWVIRCVVAYSLPEAAATLLGAEANEFGISVLRSGIASTGSLLDEDSRKRLVRDIEASVSLPFVNRTVQHSAIEWCVDTLGALLSAAIPNEVAATLVCFSDDELRQLEEKLCEAAVVSSTPLDMMMDRETKESLVRGVIPSMFSLLYDASNGDVAAAKRLRLLHENRAELKRQLKLLRASSQRKTRRLEAQLHAVEAKEAAILRQHPQPGGGWGWAPVGFLVAAGAAVGLATKAGWVQK